MKGAPLLGRVWWLAAVLPFAVDGLAQKPLRVRTMSLDDCVREAIARNHEFRIARYEPQIARHRLRLALGGYDPTFRLEVQRESEETPGGLDDFNEPVTSSESDTMRYTLSWAA